MKDRGRLPPSCPIAHTCSHSLSGIQSEADLNCHLPLCNLVILEVAAYLGNLKPPHISDRLASSRDRIVHCVFDAVWRGTDQLDLFVDVVTHKRIKPLHVASGEHIPRSKDAGHFSKGTNIFLASLFSFRGSDIGWQTKSLRLRYVPACPRRFA